MAARLGRLIPYVGFITSIITGALTAIDSAPEIVVISFLAVSLGAMWLSVILFEPKLETAVNDIAQIRIDLDARISRIPDDVAKRIGLSLTPNELGQVVHGRDLTHIYGEVRPELIIPIIKKYTEEGRFVVGDDTETTELRYLVNLTSASTSPDDISIMARQMCALIGRECSNLRNNLEYSYIATLFDGNQLLAMEVARMLRKPLLHVHHKGSAMGLEGVAGPRNAGSHVILIHDVILTGDRVARCVEAIREDNLIIDQVFTVLERTDVDPRSRDLLRQYDVNLNSLKRIDTQEIIKIYST